MTLSLLKPGRTLLGRVVALFLVLAATQALGAETLRIGGTGFALETFRLLAEGFKKTRPSLTVAVTPRLGSGGGLQALADGKLEVALSARPLRDDEKRGGITLIELARSPFAFAVASSHPAKALSTEEIVEVYEGTRKTWADGTPIRLVLRPAGDADTATLKAISPRMAKAVESALARPGMVIADNDQDNAKALETLPGALGATVVAQVRSERRALRALTLDGVAPTPEALRKGRYPLARTLYVAVAKPLSPLVEAFLQYTFSHYQTLTNLGYLAEPRD